MKYKIFVDGQEGTTGLRIHEYLSKREDLEILKIDLNKRKDQDARRELLNEADLVFLCLPDSASKESVSLITNASTKVIDASTAFRTDPEWTYGLPELSNSQREAIKNSFRISNPGCHATGFILSIYPLIHAGIMPKDYPVTGYSITGYSGGGKKLIGKYENPEGNLQALNVPTHYALKLNHKHLPEMQLRSGLMYPPLFTPVVANYYKGLAMSVPVFPRLLNKKITARDVQEFLSSYYATERFVRVMPFESDTYLEDGYFNIASCNDTNMVDIFVFGNDDQILLLSRFDNLGKGASGAAIQNMNIMLGLDEGIGLE
jgi:N-acetyl-gamma-glutamyl-phosphate reductase